MRYLVSVSHDIDISGGTHKEPNANMKMSAVFLFQLRFKLLSSGIGSKIVTRSSAMLKAAPENTIPGELTHFAPLLRFQMELIGTHCKITATRKAVARQVIQAIKILVQRRNLGLRKIRK
jgi:hypothetical protein